jgi:uncharacterized protein (UPF0332 family)
MNADDFQAFASSLAARPNLGAAAYRSAISRAYYAAYHSARELVEAGMGISCKAGGSEHKKLQVYYLNCTVDEGVELGQLLNNLHQSRRDADYTLSLAQIETQGQARLCVERASEIIDRVRACTQPPLFGQIKAGIEGYKVKTNSP